MSEKLSLWANEKIKFCAFAREDATKREIHSRILDIVDVRATVLPSRIRKQGEKTATRHLSRRKIWKSRRLHSFISPFSHPNCVLISKQFTRSGNCYSRRFRWMNWEITFRDSSVACTRPRCSYEISYLKQKKHRTSRLGAGKRKTRESKSNKWLKVTSGPWEVSASL